MYGGKKSADMTYPQAFAGWIRFNSYVSHLKNFLQGNEDRIWLVGDLCDTFEWLDKNIKDYLKSGSAVSLFKKDRACFSVLDHLNIAFGVEGHLDVENLETIANIHSRLKMLAAKNGTSEDTSVVSEFLKAMGDSCFSRISSIQHPY